MRRRWLMGAVAGLVFVASCAQPGIDRVQPLAELPLHVNFRQVLPRDAIRPIYQPEFVAADRADLRDDELVLGVAVGGEARAYPISPLNGREIVNDVVGGVPIVVTW